MESHGENSMDFENAEIRKYQAPAQSPDLACDQSDLGKLFKRIQEPTATQNERERFIDMCEKELQIVKQQKEEVDKKCEDLEKQRKDAEKEGKEAINKMKGDQYNKTSENVELQLLTMVKDQHQELKRVYEEKEQKNKELQCTLRQECAATERKLKESNNAVENKQKQLEHKSQEMAKLKEELRTNEEKLEKAIEELQLNKLESEKTENKLKEHQKQLNNRNEELKNMKEKMAKLKEELQTKGKEFEEEITKKEEELQKNSKEMAKSKEELQTKEEQMAKLKEELQTKGKEFEEEITKKEEELQKNSKEMAKSKEELQTKEEQLANTKEELRTTNERLDKTKEELRPMKEKLAVTEEGLNSYKEELEKTKEELKVIQDKLEASNADLGSAQIMLQERNQQIHAISDDRKRDHTKICDLVTELKMAKEQICIKYREVTEAQSENTLLNIQLQCTSQTKQQYAQIIRELQQLLQSQHQLTRGQDHIGVRLRQVSNHVAATNPLHLTILRQRNRIDQLLRQNQEQNNHLLGQAEEQIGLPNEQAAIGVIAQPASAHSLLGAMVCAACRQQEFPSTPQGRQQLQDHMQVCCEDRHSGVQPESVDMPIQCTSLTGLNGDE